MFVLKPFFLRKVVYTLAAMLTKLVRMRQCEGGLSELCVLRSGTAVTRQHVAGAWWL